MQQVGPPTSRVFIVGTTNSTKHPIELFNTDFTWLTTLVCDCYMKFKSTTLIDFDIIQRLQNNVWSMLGLRDSCSDWIGEFNFEGLILLAVMNDKDIEKFTFICIW